MKEEIIKVLSCSQDIPEKLLNIDPLLEQWQKAKQKWIDRFGGKPILEIGECTFELSETERRDRWKSFMDFWGMQLDRRGCWRAAEFIYEQGAEAFFRNEVVKQVDASDPPVGMKLLKALKSFIPDEDFLKEFQNAASMQIQENCVSGTFCLSVHPLDYLSLSENTYNWRSCHALDGEYRAGNLSYIVDSSSVICYLKGREEATLPNFPSGVLWNSKKWRMLLFEAESGEILAAGRQYPFFSATALDQVTEAMVKAGVIQNKRYWTKWRDEIVPASAFTFQDGTVINPRREYYNINGILVDRYKGFMDNVEGALNYNDLLHSSCYRPFLSWHWSNTAAYRDNNFFRIGSKAPCICCGKNDTFITNSMLCKECEIMYGHAESESISYCSICGDRFLTEEGQWVESTDQFVCPHCLRENFYKCSQCEEWVPNSFISEDGICSRCHRNGTVSIDGRTRTTWRPIASADMEVSSFPF